MRTIPKLYKMLHLTIQMLQFCLSQIEKSFYNTCLLSKKNLWNVFTEWDLNKIILHFYPKTENMFFKVEGSLWILIDSRPKPNSKIKGRCTILANFHHTCTHNPTCSALIIFKINFYLWLFSLFSGTRSIHLQHTKLFSSAQQPSSSSMNIHFWLSKSLSSRTNPLLISYKPVVKKLSS